MIWGNCLKWILRGMRIKKGFANTSLEGLKSCCDVDRCSELWTLLRPTHTQVPLLVTRNPKLLSTLKTGHPRKFPRLFPCLPPLSKAFAKASCKALIHPPATLGLARPPAFFHCKKLPAHPQGAAGEDLGGLAQAALMPASSRTFQTH